MELSQRLKEYGPELLDAICHGTVIPFLGAGFSKCASDRYPLFFELADKLNAELPDSHRLTREIARSNPLRVTDRVADKDGPDSLHDQICDRILPSQDKPGLVHERLMAFRWVRIYTTNYDQLLGRAGGGDYIEVATDDQYYYWKLRWRTMILKLCGDRDLRPTMRATTPRLQPASLEAECRGLYEDLIWHLDGGSFLFLGYSLGDVFLHFALQLAKVRAAARGQQARRASFIVLFEEPDDDLTDLMREHNLHVVRLDRISSNKTKAVSTFLLDSYRYCSETCPDLRWKRAPDQPSADERKSHHEASVRNANRLPVITTGGDRAKAVLQDQILPLCRAEGWETTVIDFGGADEDDPAAEGLSLDIELLRDSECAVFLIDSRRRGIEEVVARVLGERCRAVVLYSDQAHLGFYTDLLRRRSFDDADLGRYLSDQIFMGTIQDRFSRCDGFIDEEAWDVVVTQSWIAAELAVRRAYVEARQPEDGKAGQDPAVLRLIRRLVSQRGLDPVSELAMGAVEASWRTRCAVVHNGHVPTREEALLALSVTRRVASLVREGEGVLAAYLRPELTNAPRRGDTEG